MAKQSIKTKPIYTPIFRQKLGLYTEGKEWMIEETSEEYIGLYHTYPNGSVYTGPEWSNKSQLLIAYATQTQPSALIAEDGNISDADAESKNNSIYFKLTGTRFNQYYSPPFYYPEPTEEMYNVGYMSRFFVQKINEPGQITEVNPEEFDRTNTKNQPGIDQNLYKKLKIEWTIEGPVKDVRIANQKVLSFNETSFPGIINYLSDLDEFHKSRHKIKS